MKASQLISALKVALTQGFNTLIKGSPGIGKSDIINSVTAQLGYDSLICHPVVDDPTDYKGLPFAGKNGADFLPYGNLRAMLEASKPLVVFLDDLGQASQSVQAACMQLLLAREINGKKISPHVRFVAATNSRKDNAGVNGLLTPLLSRFALITELELDVEGWKQWALDPINKVPFELAAFMNFRPGLLSDFKATKEIENFACPRTWQMLGRWMNAGVFDLSVWCGCVGTGAATEFFAFYQTFTKLAGLPGKVIMNPMGTEIPDDPATLYALMGALAHKADDVTFAPIMQYAERIDRKEYQVCLVKDTITRKPKLTETRAFINWQTTNQTFIQ